MKVLLIILIFLLSIALVMAIAALICKPFSVYKHNKSEMNPMEGKIVKFIFDENSSENADGVKGYLSAVGNSEYKAGVYERIFKRLFDIILSFIGLVLLSPVFLVISLAIVIDDPGPVMFSQKRSGKNKQYFKLHKFRSMKKSAPYSIPTHMLNNPDLYITRTGRFLRAHSIDEIPQLWDIFIGNMSFVGPRPGLWNQDFLTSERDRYGANDVKPGLTGLAQINGRDELEIPEKAKLDGEYVKNISLKTDISCFFGSFHVIAKDDTIVEGGKNMNEYKDETK